MKRRVAALAALAVVSYCALAATVGAMHPRNVVYRVVAFAENADAPERSLRFNKIVMPGTSGRRVYLLHGLNEGIDYWLRPPYSVLTDHLIGRRDEIVFASLPHVLGRNLENGGQEYCSAFRRWFDATQKEIGPARETMVVGASWGAWHAMQIGDRADRMVLFKPATDPSQLNEYWWIEKGACRLTGAAESLAVYTPSDPRVGDATAALEAAGVRTIDAVSRDHGTSERDVHAAVRWIDENGPQK